MEQIENEDSSIRDEKTGSNMTAGQKQKTLRRMGPMTVGDEQWDEFIDGLLGAGGCDGNSSVPIARRILAEMGLTPTEVEQSISYFKRHGGFCDCEVVLNVDQFSADEDDLVHA
ncbi:MAG: DUF2695 domain-containing protein [Bryobacteraceae bacterium]|jgi:hypothetical protein